MPGSWRVCSMAAARGTPWRTTDEPQELAPDEKVVLVEQALGLLLLDEDDYGERARDLLQRAIDMPAKNAFDRLQDERAVERLAALGG